MASTTSIISLFIVLLAAFCSSVPVDKRPVIVSPYPEFTTGKTIIDHGHYVNMQYIPDDESTDVPKFHKSRTSDEHDGDEFTTPDHFEDHEHGSHSQRSFDDSASPMMFASESSVHDDTRSIDDFLFTTLESSTEFERRTLFSEDVSKEEFTTPSKREFEDEFTTPSKRESEDEMEMTTNFPSTSYGKHGSRPSEPSSSVDSFGKMTGLLHHDESEETLTTPKFEEADHSKEEVPHRPYQTVAVFPGKITETKIYSNSPFKTNVVISNDQEYTKPLSQGGKQPIFEKTKQY